MQTRKGSVVIRSKYNYNSALVRLTSDFSTSILTLRYKIVDVFEEIPKFLMAERYVRQQFFQR